MYARSKTTGARIVESIEISYGGAKLNPTSFRRNASGDITADDVESGIDYESSEVDAYRDANGDRCETSDVELVCSGCDEPVAADAKTVKTPAGEVCAVCGAGATRSEAAQENQSAP